VADWDVRLKFWLKPDGGAATQADWDRLSAVAGEIVGWTGEGPPSEFTSVVSIEAESDGSAVEHALDDAREALSSHELHNWEVGSLGVLAGGEAQVAVEDGYDPGGWTEGQKPAGYDPGPPPEKA
jgi:hypothetical protein